MPAVLSLGLGDPCCTHQGVCTVRQGTVQPARVVMNLDLDFDDLGLDLSSDVSVVSPKSSNKTELKTKNKTKKIHKRDIGS